jgi:hypothetical protein
MDDVQNCGSYINIPSSQTYKFYCLVCRRILMSQSLKKFWRYKWKSDPLSFDFVWRPEALTTSRIIDVMASNKTGSRQSVKAWRHFHQFVAVFVTVDVHTTRYGRYVTEANLAGPTNRLHRTQASSSLHDADAFPTGRRNPNAAAECRLKVESRNVGC